MKFNLEGFDDIKIFLPKYLSEEQQKRLFDELKSFPHNIDKRFYSFTLNDSLSIYQGDGFKQVKIPDYENETFRTAKGFLISNTCDSSLDNRRLYDSYLSFVPIISLKKYQQALLDDNHNNESVDTHIRAIMEQKVSPFFYLPETGNLGQDCFVRFDQIFSLSLSEQVIAELTSERLFTLSNYGFYMLLFKLSIHFTRIQERIDRDTFTH